MPHLSLLSAMGEPGMCMDLGMGLGLGLGTESMGDMGDNADEGNDIGTENDDFDTPINLLEVDVDLSESLDTKPIV